MLSGGQLTWRRRMKVWNCGREKVHMDCGLSTNSSQNRTLALDSDRSRVACEQNSARICSNHQLASYFSPSC